MPKARTLAPFRRNRDGTSFLGVLQIPSDEIELNMALLVWLFSIWSRAPFPDLDRLYDEPLRPTATHRTRIGKSSMVMVSQPMFMN
jgi:hypothetical protein